MKIRKINQSQNFIINLNFLQTKNYFLNNLKFKNIHCKFVKGLKIIYKYNSYDKKIIFCNQHSNVSITVKRLIKKTKHIYISNFVSLLDKLDFKKNLTYKSGLLILLATQTDTSKKTNKQIKIPNILVKSPLNSHTFETSYTIGANFLFKKHKYLFFFIFLHSVLKRLN